MGKLRFVAVFIFLSATLLSCKRDQTESGEKQSTGRSVSLFIGEINYFDSTKEFYTQLFNNNLYDENANWERDELDSLIYKDEERIRWRLNSAYAKKYFLTEGLDTIYVFNQNNEKITEADLVRFEYMDGPLESFFIAVYKPRVAVEDKNESYYGVNKDIIESEALEKVNDDKLTVKITESLTLLNQQPWIGLHFKYKPKGIIYSKIVSDTSTLITAWMEEEAEILFKISGERILDNVLPIPVVANGHLVMLARTGIRDTDALWTELLVFDGQKYAAAENNRVNVSY